MEKRFTPGPWYTDHSGERIAVNASDGSRIFLGAVSERHGRMQAEANSFLIGAAPELLDALEELLTLINCLSENELEAYRMGISRATDVIERAHGRWNRR